MYNEKEMILRTAPVCGVEGYGGGLDEDIVIANVGDRMVLHRNCVALWKDPSSMEVLRNG